MGLTVQTVDRRWTVDELLARKSKEQASAWAEGDLLTFFYQGEADEVEVCCGIQLPMQRLEDSDLWVLTVKVRDLPKAVIGYGFMARRKGQPVDGNMTFTQWRGPQAPPPPRRAQPLLGRIQRETLESAALGERRDLTIYFPPGYDADKRTPVIYAADGQSVVEFATVLEPLIADSSLPPILLVGVHLPLRPFSSHEQDLRAQEYLPDRKPERFAAHERFFVEEVAAWAERELGAASDREQRGVFGYSNGAVFAAAMGLRHPDRYGHVLAFSLGISPGSPTHITAPAPGFYLAAGTLEEGFHRATADFAKALQALGVRHVFHDRVSGHDHSMWEEEFPAAVVWAFGTR